MRTAVVVNDRGEALVGWAFSVSFDVSGSETYFRVPVFAARRAVVHGPNDFVPSGRSAGEPYFVNDPYVFSSEVSAERAVLRMRGRVLGRLAVVS